jgi:hypothetical protein
MPEETDVIRDPISQISGENSGISPLPMWQRPVISRIEIAKTQSGGDGFDDGDGCSNSG